MQLASQHFLRHLLQEPQRLRITLEYRRGETLRLLERDMWRQRRDIRIDVRLEQGRTVRREDRFPCGADLIGLVDSDTREPERFGVSCVRDCRMIQRAR